MGNHFLRSVLCFGIGTITQSDIKAFTAPAVQNSAREPG
jgi:hypothetical protein